LANDTYARCVNAIETAIDSLSITHRGRTVPTLQHTIPNIVADELPAFLLTFEDLSEQIESAAFGEYDVIYPLNIWIADRQPANDDTLIATYQGWKKQIIGKLQPLDRLSDSSGEIRGVYDVQVQAYPNFNPQYPKYQYLVSGLMVRVYTRDV